MLSYTYWNIFTINRWLFFSCFLVFYYFVQYLNFNTFIYFFENVYKMSNLINYFHNVFQYLIFLIFTGMYEAHLYIFQMKNIIFLYLVIYSYLHLYKIYMFIFNKTTSVYINFELSFLMPYLFANFFLFLMYINL